ncbi:MAG: hypothetical protein KC503_39420 [Myxococcales bacterium]|nr:hypothetical protein [Myxococcales bacterium]
MHRRSLQLLTLVTALCAASSARGQTLRAVRLRITRARIEAEGRVRLGLGGCRLLAHKLVLDRLRRRLEVFRPELQTPGLRLTARRLLRVPSQIVAEHALVELCACASRGAGPSLRVRARRARVSSDGARLHLSWPVLSLGRLPLLAAPYWAVPLHPGVSGLLAPQLGYSARDGVRLALPVYLAPSSIADVTLAPGFVQSRGVSIAARARVFAHGDAGATIATRVLDDSGTLRAAARGGLWIDGARPGTSLGLALDLVSDETLVRDLSRDPDRVFSPYARTRLWSGWARGPVYAMLALDALERLQPPALETGATARPSDPRPLRARAAARIALAPLPLAWGFFALASVDAVYRSDALAPSAAGAPTPALGSELFLEVSPALALARSIGRLLRFDALARYRLQSAFGLERENDGRRSEHSARFGAELSLPLARLFRGPHAELRHVVSPFVGWQAAVGTRRLVEGGRSLAIGEHNAALAGVRSQLWRDGRALARGALALLAGSDTRRLLARLRLGTRHHLVLRGLFDLSSADAGATPRAADLEGRLCLAPGAALLCGGFVRQRLSALGELLATDGARWSIVSALDAGPVDIPAADQLRFALRAPLGRLSLALALAVDARSGRIAYARYHASARFGCRDCYRVGVTVLSRDGQRYDGLVELTIRPGALWGCR